MQLRLPGFLPALSSRQRSTLLIAFLCSLAGSALGLLIVPRAPEPRAATPELPPLSLLGEPLGVIERGAEPSAIEGTGAAATLNAGRASVDLLLEEAQRRLGKLLDKTFTVTASGSPSLALPLAKWGLQVDRVRLEALLQNARDPSSPQLRLWQQDASSLGTNSQRSDSSTEPAQLEQNATGTRDVPLPLTLDFDKARAHLADLKERADRRSERARYDVGSKQVIPHVDGRSLDVERTLLELQRAVEGGSFRIEAAFVLEPAPRTKRELEKLRFDTVLGHFETRYSQADNAKDRTFNLRLAASRLDGTVLFPGETFDFNEVVGPRDEAHGYRVATVIADGELVDGIGGGTCQISGTLHGAAFFAGLEIVERYPHTRPSSYIKMGMDATVVYPTITFRVKNSFGFPVVLHQKVEEGAVRAEVRGAPVDQVVSLIRRIDDVIPYEELERTDSTLPKGHRILAQRGVPGFRLHRYRTIRRGSHTTREKWRDVYPPTAQVIRVGTGKAEQPKRSGVKTPEYRADELLILTLRRPTPGEAAEFAENREPGEFGRFGWTKKAGMPFWEDD